MSAGEHLSTQQFHGARMRIDDTHVRPPSQTGAESTSSSGYSSGYGKPSHKDLAFATPTEHIAWLYAHAVPTSKDHPVNNDPDPKYRSRVYTVAPSSDQHVDFPSDSEIKSATGYRITGAHDIAPGATGTFPTHNWNAFKPRKSGSPFVSHTDLNHSYMQGPHEASGPKSEPHVEVAGQMNLLTGRTVEDHKDFVETPGYDLHLHLGAQFNARDIEDFHRDPTVRTLRSKQPYHEVDTHLKLVN